MAADTCPHCGSEMVWDEPQSPPDRDLLQHCEACAYWEELIAQLDGTLIAVGHVPEVDR